MATIIYQEKQRFHDWLIVGLLLLAVIGLLFGAASIFWNAQATVVYSLICVGLAAGLGYAIYWLTSLRSKLTITKKKIKFKFKGPLATSKKIAWGDIESCSIVKSNTIARWERPKVTISDEKFYSLSGRNGLMIKTWEGEHYLIGCENIGELERALNEQEEIWEMIEG